MDFIDLKSQYAALRESVNARIQRVLDHGQYIMGPEVIELEERLAEFVGSKYCITASSGTDTLLLAMMALGVGRGHEVITTPFTFIATGEVIALLGATPIFVDIEPDTFNLDPTKIEEAITPNTRAIMPVSLYGQCADMDAINAIAERHRLAVIEDAAQSFGALYRGRRSCSLSTIGSTSFFPSKPLGAYGDGGALFTDDPSLAKLMRELRVHGQDKRYHHPRIGINGRLDTIQAAVLLSKLEMFEWEIGRRAALGARYTELLNASSAPALIQTPILRPHSSSVFAQYTVRVRDRANVVEHLRERGIPTAVHYPIPLHAQPAFEHLGHRAGSLPVAEKAATEVMSLPMGPYLREDEQDAVVQAIGAVPEARDAVTESLAR